MGESDEVTVSVTILNVNEPPTLVYGTGTVEEMVEGATIFGPRQEGITVSDEDEGTEFEFELESASAGGSGEDAASTARKRDVDK